MKTALVLGSGGFIGHHMVKQLKLEGYFVRGVDLKYPEFSQSHADEFIIGDLRETKFVKEIIEIEQNSFNEIYQFAADMGGAGYVFTGENDADIMHNSAMINLNLLECQRELNQKISSTQSKIFYSSSACMYPSYNQNNPDNPNCAEESAYPAEPDSEYGWEKLFSERLFLAYNRNFKISVCIARYHNIYGPEGTWMGGREKAPAAICRKVALADSGGSIDIWGDGSQTRSFLYIDDCIEATRMLMKSESFFGPVNIGSEEKVSINELVGLVSRVAHKTIYINHTDGPTGVRGRNSDNDLIRKRLSWDSKFTLEVGLKETYQWIQGQINNQATK